jgi:hypothetical protein
VKKTMNSDEEYMDEIYSNSAKSGSKRKGKQSKALKTKKSTTTAKGNKRTKGVGRCDNDESSSVQANQSQGDVESKWFISSKCFILSQATKNSTWTGQ